MMLSSLCVAVIGSILIDPLIGQHVRIYHEIMDDSTGWTLGNNDGAGFQPKMPYTNTNCVNTPRCCYLPFLGGWASKIFSTEGYHNIYVKLSVTAKGNTNSMDTFWLYLYPDANFNANMNTYWYSNTLNIDNPDPALNINFYPSPNANYIDNKPNMKLKWVLETETGLYWVYLSHLEIYGIPITANPTIYPINDPTYDPTLNPTKSSESPTFNPTKSPPFNTTKSTTFNTTNNQIEYPTIYPTRNPSTSPTDVASGNVLATNITAFQPPNGDGNGNNNEEFIWILISILSVITCITIVFAVYFNKKRKRLTMSRSMTNLTAVDSETNIENECGMDIEFGATNDDNKPEISGDLGDNNDLPPNMLGSVEKECEIELDAMDGDNEPEISDDSGEDLYSNMHTTNGEMITPNYKSPIKDESETEGNNETANKTTCGTNDGGIGDV